MDEQFDYPDLPPDDGPILPDEDHAVECGEVALDVATTVNARTEQVESLIHLLIANPEEFEQASTRITLVQAKELVQRLIELIAVIELQSMQ